MPPSKLNPARLALALLVSLLWAGLARAKAPEVTPPPATSLPAAPSAPASAPSASPVPRVSTIQPVPPVPPVQPAACAAGMRPLDGGRFTLADGSATVVVEPFCLDAIEVSAYAYAGCVKAGACASEGVPCSRAATYGVKGKGNHPVNCVSWVEADAFCSWQGERLPTEGEWEWAARGQQRASRYPWGDAEPGRRACWDGKGSALGAGGRQGTCPIAAHPDGDSPDGIHDLAGNVREWTASGDERERVIRGGSWGDSIDWFLAAGFRGLNYPSERFELTGFRCAAAPVVAQL